MAVRRADRRAVLHVLQPDIAGVPNVVGDLLEFQTRAGWSVVVAGPTGVELETRTFRSGAAYVGWNARREPGPHVAVEVHALRNIVQSVAPDLVHLHSSKAGMAGRLAVRGGRPTIFQPHAWSFLAAHGGAAYLAGQWERFAMRWTDALVCVSQGELDAGISHGVQGRSWIAPNGVDIGRWPLALEEARQAARGRLGLSETQGVVLCVGRLCRQKGQDLLLRAWRALHREFPAASLVLVGGGPDEQRLRALGVAGVVMPGWRDDVGEWIAASDLVVLPSRWEAGLPLVAMEAMSRGRSVVAADVAGVREGLEPGAGAVVPVDDWKALATAIRLRLGDPSRAAEEGRKGRRIVEERYSLRATAAVMARIYQDVLTRRSETESRAEGAVW